MAANTSIRRARAIGMACLVAIAGVGCQLPPRRLKATSTPFAAVAPATPLGESDPGNEPTAMPGRLDDAPAPAAPQPLVHALVAGAQPCTLTVEVGQELEFVNQDEICHSLFSSSTGNAFATGLLQPHDRVRVHFANPGQVQVYCSLHEHRQLTILVLPSRAR